MAALSFPLSPLLRKYWVCTNPRVSQLAVFCAVIRMFLASPGLPNPLRVLLATIGIWLLAAAAFAINCLIEHEVDARMARTARRATALGTISHKQVLSLSGLLGCSDMIHLYYEVKHINIWLHISPLLCYVI